jgi:hypothetical protein
VKGSVAAHRAENHILPLGSSGGPLHEAQAPAQILSFFQNIICRLIVGALVRRGANPGEAEREAKPRSRKYVEGW